MTWLDTLARRWGRAPRGTAPTRARRFRPDLEALQRRDVPAAMGAASISGYVYCDCNDNGKFDSGESPIGGVTVTLAGHDVNGFAVSLTTTTDATGLYSFKTLPGPEGTTNLLSAGTYTVHEVQPTGVADGKDTPGTPLSGTVSNDTFVDVVLGSGVDAVNYNFGEHCQDFPPPPPPPPPKGSICGIVYADCNKNGKFDSGESGIAGVKVTLTGPNGFSRTATTDSGGRYSFDNLVAGSYKLTETQPTGYMQGANTPGIPANGMVNGDMISGIVVGGAKLTNYNFGETSKDCGCDNGSHGKGSGGKCHNGSHGKGSHGMCDNGSHGKGSHGKGSGGKCDNGSHGKGSHGRCDNGSHGKGSSGKGSGGKGSHGKGSHGVCDNGKGSHGKGSNGKGSHAVCGSGCGGSSHC